MHHSSGYQWYDDSKLLQKEDWNKYNALGVTSYGQMTAGSFMYIGPQGIVHGTTITLLNAGRKMGLGQDNLAGACYVLGLGGVWGTSLSSYYHRSCWSYR